MVPPEGVCYDQGVIQPLTISDPDEILTALGQIALRGSGFTTESLLESVLDAGFTEPIYLSATGEDPNAFYQGQAPAWATYQIREWKRVFTVSVGSSGERRSRITETP